MQGWRRVGDWARAARIVCAALTLACSAAAQDPILPPLSSAVGVPNSSSPASESTPTGPGPTNPAPRKPTERKPTERTPADRLPAPADTDSEPADASAPPLTVEELLFENPLRHQGPFLDTPQGMLPVESLSGPLGGAAEADLYDDLRGIEIIGADADTPMSLRIGGRLQLRHTYFKDRGVFENPTSNQFDVARARLGFRGHIFEPYLRYNLGTNLSVSDAKLVNAFVEVDLQDALGVGFGTSTALRYGYWRTNFGRQAAESSQNLQFVDRSLTSSVFNLGNNTGLSLLGGFTHWYRPVRYELNLSNGFGTFGLSDRGSLDDNLAVAMRVTEEVVGEYGTGESDNDLSPFAAIRVGASGAYTRRTRRGPGGASSEFDNSPALLLVDDPQNGDAVFAMDQLLGSEQAYDLWLMGLEADCKHAGWSLHSEYLCRWISNVQFTSDHQFRDFTHGFYVQGGYFLTEKLELVTRHSTIYADGKGTGSPVGRDYHTTSNATGGGLNLYFRRQYSKLQFDVFYYDGASLDAPALNLIAGDRGVMFRTQYQAAF